MGNQASATKKTPEAPQPTLRQIKNAARLKKSKEKILLAKEEPQYDNIAELDSRVTILKNGIVAINHSDTKEAHSSKTFVPEIKKGSFHLAQPSILGKVREQPLTVSLYGRDFNRRNQAKAYALRTFDHPIQVVPKTPAASIQQPQTRKDRRAHR